MITTPPNTPAGSNPQTVERRGACRRCGRILRNPKHAANGIGPVCARKGLAAGAVNPHVAAPKSHARYEVTMVEKDRVSIRDLGPWDKHPTVTNDAQHVVNELAEAGHLTPGRRLFYLDSEGQAAEIVLNTMIVTGFRHVPAEGADGDVRS